MPDDENLLPLNSVDSYIKDISNRDSQPRNRRPERQAAIKAKKLLSNCFKVQKKNREPNPPMHGCDYSKFIELVELDDEDSQYLSLGEYSTSDHDIDSNISTDEASQDSIQRSTQSSTLQRSPSNIDNALEDMLLDQGEAISVSSSPSPRDSALHPTPPDLPPRLPQNLLERQNLTEQLNFPEVVVAAQLEDIVGNLRSFNKQHPTKPQASYSLSRRNVSKPRNYALYDKTGQK